MTGWEHLKNSSSCEVFLVCSAWPWCTKTSMPGVLIWPPISQISGRLCIFGMFWTEVWRPQCTKNYLLLMFVCDITASFKRFCGVNGSEQFLWQKGFKYNGWWVYICLFREKQLCLSHKEGFSSNCFLNDQHMAANQKTGALISIWLHFNICYLAFHFLDREDIIFLFSDQAIIQHSKLSNKQFSI